MLKLNGFRAATLAFACVLSFASVWLLTAELARIGSPSSLAVPETMPPSALQHDMAEFAAEFGMVRGDLWAEYALTFDDLISTSEDRSDQLEIARTASLRALKLAPHNTKVWVLLAAIESRSGKPGQVSKMLKMSYYTGANETELMPSRLRLALRLEISDDPDLRQLVGQEIRTMARQPGLKPAIAAAYREASATGKSLLESTLMEFDPVLLASIRVGKKIDMPPDSRR